MSFICLLAFSAIPAFANRTASGKLVSIQICGYSSAAVSVTIVFIQDGAYTDVPRVISLISKRDLFGQMWYIGKEFTIQYDGEYLIKFDQKY
jgi:hypothetical protein